jgi:hypothetical protein
MILLILLVEKDKESYRKKETPRKGGGTNLLGKHASRGRSRHWYIPTLFK